MKPVVGAFALSALSDPWIVRLERENSSLKNVAADLILDKAILRTWLGESRLLGDAMLNLIARSPVVSYSSEKLGSLKQAEVAWAGRRVWGISGENGAHGCPVSSGRGSLMLKILLRLL
jgi:hypothetical protein